MDKCWKCRNDMEIIRNEPYHYTECGLENVYLFGIVQYRCPECGEETVSIPNIKGLHLVIARALVCKEEMLSGDEVKFLRKELKLRSKNMAEALSMEPETYSRWENAKQKVSSNYDKELRLMYILNASEENGRVLHRDIRAMLLAMAIRPLSEPKKIELSAADWLVPMEPPIFGIELCK